MITFQTVAFGISQKTKVSRSYMTQNLKYEVDVHLDSQQKKLCVKCLLLFNYLVDTFMNFSV